MAIYIPSKRILTSQTISNVRINPDNDLARDITNCFPLANYTGDIVNPTTQFDLTSNGLFGFYGDKLAVGSNGAGYLLTNSTVNNSGPTKLSVSSWLNETATGSGSHAFYWHLGAGYSSGGDYVSLYKETGAGLVLHVDVKINGQNKVHYWSGLITQNVWAHFVVNINTDDNTIELYKNGVYIAKSGSFVDQTFTSYPTPSGKLALFSDTANVSGFRAKAAIYNLTVRKNRLTAKEVYEEYSNPWQIFKSTQLTFIPAAAGGSTGTLAKTNADDAISATGTTQILGVLAKTNSNDAISASGKTTIIGSLSKTHANDSLAASGSIGSPVSGTLAKTHANDAISATGTTQILGVLAKTNSNDAIAASGKTTIVGSLSKTHANDSLAASGSIGSAVSGTLARTNANDAISATGTTQILGVLAKTNSNDAISASGKTTIVGSLSKTHANDSLAASGSIGSAVSGTLARTNANDAISATGTTQILGALAKSNSNDAIAASGKTTIVGSLSKTHANDSLAASGTVSNGVSGYVNYSHPNDAVVAIGTTDIIGVLFKASNNDSVIAVGKTTVVGTLAKTTANDTLAAVGFMGDEIPTIEPLRFQLTMNKDQALTANKQQALTANLTRMQ